MNTSASDICIATYGLDQYPDHETSLATDGDEKVSGKTNGFVRCKRIIELYIRVLICLFKKMVMTFEISLLSSLQASNGSIFVDVLD